MERLADGGASIGKGAKTDSWAIGFNNWLTSAVITGDRELLAGYRTMAPFGKIAHLYPDHFMPLLVAFGAAGNGARGSVLHQSWYWGDLGMGAYEFGSGNATTGEGISKDFQ